MSNIMSEEEINQRKKWSEEIETTFSESDWDRFYHSDANEVVEKAFFAAKKSSLAEVTKWEKIARCPYKHEFFIHPQAGYCPKCGWMQTMTERPEYKRPENIEGVKIISYARREKLNELDCMSKEGVLFRVAKECEIIGRDEKTIDAVVEKFNPETQYEEIKIHWSKK